MRAAMLDEGLDLLDELWGGETVDHAGVHYRAEGVRFLPRPAQRPRIPIWVAGRWPHRRPLRRAARWDGVFLIDLGGPQDLAEAVAELRAERGDLDGFEVVCDGPAGADPRPWAEAGATWWLVEPPSTDPAAVRAALAAGPPHS